MASVASDNSNKGSTAGFAENASFNSSSTNLTSPSQASTSKVFEPEPAPAPAAKKIKLRTGPTIGQKRAEEARAAKAAKEPKAPNASTLPPPPKGFTEKPKANSRKNKKPSNNNNSASIASTEANIGFNKPHLRKVETNNGETVNTSVGSAAFENSTGTASEGERGAADAAATPAGNNRSLSNFEADDLKDVGAADIQSEAEEPEVANASAQPITPMADKSMYLLLRIGDDSSSEYIELRKQPMASMGSFNTHSIGSTKEIQNLYGIRSSEDYKAMQRAFGVPRYGKKAPFDDYIYVKQCKFRGFDIVRSALQQRIRTLEESIRIANQGTINSNRNKHFVEVLKKMVEGMSSVRKVCPAEAAKPVATAAATQTNTKPAEGCPCLEDLTLLRDLVFLVAMIQNTAIPEVKKQLESIPLNRILNNAAKPDEKRSIIQQALDALKTVSLAEKVVKANTGVGTDAAPGGTNAGVGTDAAPGGTNAGVGTDAAPGGTNAGVGTDAAPGGTNAGVGTDAVEPQINTAKIQEILRAIWKVLTKQDATEDITQEQIIHEIEALLAKVADFEVSKQRCAEVGAELDELRKRYMALQELLGKVEEGGNGDDPYEEIEYLADQLQKAADLATEQSGKIDSLTEQLATKTQGLAALQTEKSAANTAAATEKARLETEIAGLRAMIDEQGASATALQAKYDALKAGVESLRAKIKEAKGAMSETKAKIIARVGEDAAIILALQQQLRQCQAEKAGLITAGTSKNAQAAETARQIGAKDAEITGLQGQLAEAKGNLEGSVSEVAALRKELAEERAESLGKNARIEELEGAQEKAGESIQSLRQEMNALKATILALEDAHRQAQDECADKQAELSAQLADKTAETAASDKLVQELGAALEEAEVKAARANAAEANARDLEQQLAETAARLAAEGAAADAAKEEHEAQLAGINAALAGARSRLTELEGQIGDAKTASDGQKAELEELRAHIKSLEAKLEAKGASGTAAQEAFEKANTALEAQISKYKAAIAEAQEEIDGIPALEQEKLATEDALKAAEARISALKTQMATLEAERDTRERNLTTAAAKKNANVQAKNAAHDAAMADLTKRLGEAEAARDKAIADAAAAQAAYTASNAQKNAASAAKNVTIGQLQENRKQKHFRIIELEKQLSELESIKAASATKNETIAAQSTQIATLGATIDELQQNRRNKLIRLERLGDESATKNETIASLKASLEAAKTASSGSLAEKSAELEGIKKELAAAREALEAAIATDKAKDAQRDEKIRECEERLAAAEAAARGSLAAKSAELEEIKQQLTAAQATLKAAVEADAEKDAERERKIRECEERLAAALAEERAGRTANQAAAAAAAREAAEAAEAELAKLRAEKEASEAKQKEALKALRSQITQLEQDLATALAQKGIAEEAGLKAVKERGMQAQEEVSAATAAERAKLAALQAEFDTLKDALERAITDEKTATKKRLDTLLGMIVINEDMKKKAMDWWNGEGSAKNIEAVGKDLLNELCDFFTYLSGLLNMQMRKLNATSLPPEAKLDIFKIFKELPADMPSDKEILKEITLLFQELFVKVAKTNTVEPRTLTANYPSLHKFLKGFSVEGGEPLRAQSRGYGNELGSFSFFTNTGLVPVADNKLEIKSKTMDYFTLHNEDHYVPLIVFGIKLIQLLSKNINAKYGDLKKRCGGQYTAIQEEAARIGAAYNSDEE